jgi:hypothetical protein
VTVKYGGLADYTKAVNALGLTWPVLDRAHPLPNGNSDFMIYATGDHDYWSGYFSSRPKLKGYARSRDHVLRHMELLMTAANTTLKDRDLKAGNNETDGGGDSYDRAGALSAITKLRRSVGVTQHHDAITGTERQGVSDDYMIMMQSSTTAAENATSKVAALLLAKKPATTTTTGSSKNSLKDAPGLEYSLSEYATMDMGKGNLPSCVSWRQTSSCDPKGKREPNNDKNCNAKISCPASKPTNTSGCDSGFCECAGGIRRGNFDCGRLNASTHSFTCNQLCEGVPAPTVMNTTVRADLNTLPFLLCRATLFSTLLPFFVFCCPISSHAYHLLPKIGHDRAQYSRLERQPHPPHRHCQQRACGS